MHLSKGCPLFRRNSPYSITCIQTQASPISLQYNQLVSQGKILSSQIGDDIKPPTEQIVESLDENEHCQTLIWKHLKRNGINAYEYLRRTGLALLKRSPR